MDTQYVCDPVSYYVCPCIEIGDDHREFECQCVHARDAGRQCIECGAHLILIDVDTGARVDPPVKRRAVDRG